MKDIQSKLIPLLKEGYCVPQIARIAKKIQEPSTTIHYNIHKLEREGKIKSYKAVFDYRKIEEGFCCFVLLNLSPDEYGDPEKISRELAKHPQIESIDVCTGDWELLLKVRSKDQNDYYQFVKTVISRKGVIKTKTLISLKQFKTEFVTL